MFVVRKLGMWSCRRNKSDVCGIGVRNCKYFCQVAVLQQHLTMESVNNVGYNTFVVILFLFAENVWVRHIPPIIAIFTEVLWSTEAPFFLWTKTMMASKTGKAPSISHTEIFQEFFVSGRGQVFCPLVL